MKRKPSYAGVLFLFMLLAITFYLLRLANRRAAPKPTA
jgi:hypothetical protein